MALEHRFGAVIGPWQGRYWMGGAEKLVFSDQPEANSFCAFDFALHRNQIWFRPEEIWTTDLKNIQDAKSSITKPKWKSPSRKDFQRNLEMIKQAIDRGEIHKLVPIVFETTNWRPQPADITSLIKNLSGIEDSGLVFGWWNEQEGCLGITPEVLFEIEGRTLRTMALAGTYDLEKTAADFLADPKEREEHQWVIEDLEGTLSAFGKVKVGATSVLKLRNMQHLQTPIECELAQKPDVTQLIQALHPTAALGGAPRDKAARFLIDQENYFERETFGAPFVFYQSPEKILAVVSIRCLQWNTSGSRIGSGCGIVRRSDLGSEWTELKLKRQAVKEMLGL